MPGHFKHRLGMRAEGFFCPPRAHLPQSTFSENVRVCAPYDSISNKWVLVSYVK
jgi:hypothetical protein